VGDAALGIALDQQGLDLRVLHRFAHGGRHEPRLVAAGLARVAGMTAAVIVAADFRTAAFGASVNCRDHEPHTKLILD